MYFRCISGLSGQKFVAVAQLARGQVGVSGQICLQPGGTKCVNVFQTYFSCISGQKFVAVAQSVVRYVHSREGHLLVKLAATFRHQKTASSRPRPEWTNVAAC